MALDLPDGTECFLDANILYYHFVETPPHSEMCSDLLDRIASRRVVGMTSAHLVAEAVHKIMAAEAAARFGLGRAGLVTWLQRHPQSVRELRLSGEAAAEISSMGLLILPVDQSIVVEGANISQQLGLLTNDAMLVAQVRRQGLHDVATNDDDFCDVPGLTLWQPR